MADTGSATVEHDPNPFQLGFFVNVSNRSDEQRSADTRLVGLGGDQALEHCTDAPDLPYGFVCHVGNHTHAGSVYVFDGDFKIA